MRATTQEFQHKTKTSMEKLKRFRGMPVFLLVLFIAFGFAALPAANYVRVDKVGEMGTGSLESVHIEAGYAYCAADRGLEIYDVSNPSTARLISTFESRGYGNDGIAKEGNYYYLGSDYGLHILDVANPASPALASLFPIHGVSYCKGGNYVFVVNEPTIHVIDVSNPLRPVAVDIIEDVEDIHYIVYHNNYLYLEISGLGRLVVVDVRNPADAGSVTSVSGFYGNNLTFKDNLMYSTNYQEMAVHDISDPIQPQEIFSFRENITHYGTINLSGNHMYVGSWIHGAPLWDYDYKTDIFDISDPREPRKIGEFEDYIGGPGFFTNQNELYVGGNGLYVYDVSNFSQPVLQTHTPTTVGNSHEIAVSGDILCKAENGGPIRTYDISDKESPRLLSSFSFETYECLSLCGNYLYVGGHTGDPFEGFSIIDITDPSAPVLAAEVADGDRIRDVWAVGNTAYSVDGYSGLSIYDVTNPSSPQLLGTKRMHSCQGGSSVDANHVFLAYREDNVNRFAIVDVSDPTATEVVSRGEGRWAAVKGNILYSPDAFGIEGGPGENIHMYDISDFDNIVKLDTFSIENYNGIGFLGDYLVVRNETGIRLLDTENPTALPYAGAYGATGIVSYFRCHGDYIYTGDAGKLQILKVSPADSAPRIELNRDKLYFTIDASGRVTPPQTIGVGNSGGSNLSARLVSTTGNWCHFVVTEPKHISGSSDFHVGIDVLEFLEDSPSPGTYTAVFQVIDDIAVNSPLSVEVEIRYKADDAPVQPFGQLSTPMPDAVVSGSVPVTGWAMDDVGVHKVSIYAAKGNQSHYIGKAVFVEGARPDVAVLYPGYPMDYRAGWGYMLLTNYLPGGDGDYVLEAFAEDVEGNSVSLGTRAIRVANGSATAPFGTLDTPAQGGLASGDDYTVFGWALTPQPAQIPGDGSHIELFVDGRSHGHPEYDIPRSDIEALFPGYANSGGPVGYSRLNTKELSNGNHSIHWVVTDDAGNSAGIGSRYFKAVNTDATFTHRRSAARVASGEVARLPADTNAPLRVKAGLGPNVRPEAVAAGQDGMYRVHLKELDNLEIRFPQNGGVAGFMLVGKKLLPLPVGTCFNESGTVFYWHPGPGFYGEYRFVFIQKDGHGNSVKKAVQVIIGPKSYKKQTVKGPSTFLTSPGNKKSLR